MKTMTSAFTRAMAIAGAGLAFASTASALDQRSWDQRINDATKRFVVLAAFNNEAVLDKETQLVWARSSYPNDLSWMQAVRHCGARAIGGRHGWRLPTGAELMSLLDPARAFGNKLPSGHPFQGQMLDRFWTSSLAPASTDTAMVVSTISGVYDTNFVTQYVGRALCVRGGGMPDHN